MTTQALIFDLSAFAGRHVIGNATATTSQSGLDAEGLLNEAVEQGIPCALISELPYRQANEHLRDRFGDAAHHIFSVVLTGADFKECGHRAPYSIVLNQLGIPPNLALAVTASPHAITAARTLSIDVPTSLKTLTVAERAPLSSIHSSTHRRARLSKA